MKKLIYYFFSLIMFHSCSNIDLDAPVDISKLGGTDYRLFQNSSAWELAKAVKNGQSDKINTILRSNPELVNQQEPVYGNTLLHLTIVNQQLKEFRQLIDHRADVNIHDKFSGRTPLIEACLIGDLNIEFINILLDHNANANDIEVGPRKKGNSIRYTPLIAAAETGRIDVLKKLIDHGADISFQNEYAQSAFNQSVISQQYAVVLFLLQNGADYTSVIYRRPGRSANYDPAEDKPMYLLDVLREDVADLNSEKHRQKMAVVAFLKTRGIDYWSTPVPDFILKKIKEDYPVKWQKVLKEY